MKPWVEVVVAVLLVAGCSSTSVEDELKWMSVPLLDELVRVVPHEDRVVAHDPLELGQASFSVETEMFGHHVFHSGGGVVLRTRHAL